MTNAFALVLASTLSALAAGTTQAQKPGFVRLNVQGEAHLFTSKKLGPKTQVQFQFLNRSGAISCCLTRHAEDFALVEEDPAATDSATGETLLRYRLLKAPRLVSSDGFIGAAMIGHRMAPRSGPNQTPIAGPRRDAITVSTCTSKEGVHLKAQRGKTKLADFYFGLDYEIESPTCPPE
jgi:hypothetical protein